MARQTRLVTKDEIREFRELLFRAIQSSHLNFLIGSGASALAISPAGQIEQEIAELVAQDKQNEALAKTLTFLKEFVDPTRQLLDGATSQAVSDTLRHYTEFVQTIDLILGERKTNLLPKQATVFTTNYDLFLERAAEDCPTILLNDGFNRTPSLSGTYKYASERLFDAAYHTGNHYDYTVELPSLNLVKLHGSLNWAKLDGDIKLQLCDLTALSAVNVKEKKAADHLLEKLAIILPTRRKFSQTLLERIYYDLLRIFANVLEREGSLLLAFGFSFADEHIEDIVRRALRNPTLKLIVFCFTPADVEAQLARFSSYNNVSVVIPSQEIPLSFRDFNKLLHEAVFARESA